MINYKRLKYILNRIRERLWVKPLLMCIFSIMGVFAAKFADGTRLTEIVPDITAESVETLLSVMAASMLVIATFAVASMVSAYASASSAATPRSFTLVIADDVSQNALSTFIGAFIFSIVALTTMLNDYFATAGRFTLFTLTVLVFLIVILTFVRWVDRIARLGRIGATIDKVEQATAAAIRQRREAPLLHGVPLRARHGDGVAVYTKDIGYIQSIDIPTLQCVAEEHDVRVSVAALPGTFRLPGQALAYVHGAKMTEDICQAVAATFLIGADRVFDEDPRFGFVVLSEIAGRALSQAVNDPGTAIDVIGSQVRLFSLWHEHAKQGPQDSKIHDRVEVPEIAMQDMFDDAFTVIGRDGAASVEVAVRLQKALKSLATLDDAAMRDAAISHARMALRRSENAMSLDVDLDSVRKLACFAEEIKWSTHPKP